MTLKSRGPVPIYYESLYGPIWYMNLKTLLGFISSLRYPAGFHGDTNSS